MSPYTDFLHDRPFGFVGFAGLVESETSFTSQQG
jgi:hypothetical protein